MKYLLLILSVFMIFSVSVYANDETGGSNSETALQSITNDISDNLNLTEVYASGEILEEISEPSNDSDTENSVEDSDAAFMDSDMAILPNTGGTGIIWILLISFLVMIGIVVLNWKNPKI